MRKSKAEKKKQREIHNRRQSIEVGFYPGCPRIPGPRVVLFSIVKTYFQSYPGDLPSGGYWSNEQPPGKYMAAR